MARAALLALCLLFAGCAAGPVSSADDLSDQLKDVPVTTTDTTGCLLGVVVDESIRPIGNATILLAPGNRTAKADTQGRFSFCALQPATYFAKASALGFIPTQSSGEVKAGEATTIRIALPADRSPRPYHTTVKFEGYIQAAGSIASFATDLVLGTFLNVSLCTCTYNFYAEPAVVAITQEVTWTDSVPRSPAMASTKYREMFPTNGVTTDSIKSAFEGSPMLVTFNRTATWPGGDDGQFTARVTGDGYWVEYDQRYTEFITLWAHGQPPAGWSFVKGDK